MTKKNYPVYLLCGLLAGAIAARGAERLRGEASAFLRSNSGSPVDWMTWGDEITFKMPHSPPLDQVAINRPRTRAAPRSHVAEEIDRTRAVAAPDPDGLDIPDFLRRGHPDCVIGNGRP